MDTHLAVFIAECMALISNARACTGPVIKLSLNMITIRYLGKSFYIERARESYEQQQRKPLTDNQNVTTRLQIGQFSKDQRSHSAMGLRHLKADQIERQWFVPVQSFASSFHDQLVPP